MNTLIRLALTALAVYGLAHFLDGIAIADWQTTVWVALVFALLNTFLRPALIIVTIPVTFLTLGLFLLVINAFLVMLCDFFVDGFTVASFWWALLFSVLLSIAQGILYSLFGVKKGQKKAKAILNH